MKTRQAAIARILLAVGLMVAVGWSVAGKPSHAQAVPRESGSGQGAVSLSSAASRLLRARANRAPGAPLGADASTILLSEDFESAAWPAGTNWTVFDDNGASSGEYFWANRCTGHHTDHGAWAIGGGASGRTLSTCTETYPENLESWMIYGPLDLSRATAAKLDFVFWLNSECQGTQCVNKADKLWALASTDGTSFNGAWFAGDWKDDPGSHHGGWNDGSLDLQSYVGRSGVYIALNFDSDSTVGYPGGAFVDDVVVTAETSCATTVSIRQITPDRTCYVPGATIGTLVDLANTGAARDVDVEVTVWSGDVIWASASRRFAAPGQQVIPATLPSGLFPGDYTIWVKVTDPASPGCVLDRKSVTVRIDTACGSVTAPIPTTATPTRTPSITATPTPSRTATATPTLEATLCPGETVHETKAIFIPAAPARADVLFAFDTTQSMGSVLSSAKTNAISIMGNLAAVIPDIQFGVVDLRDYPVAPYGDAGDWPYRLRQPVTADRSAVAAAIDATGAGGGNDYPEAYSRALYETGTDGAIGWRPDARQFVVMFGDDVPHDNDLNERIVNPLVNPGANWCGNTSAGCVRDPGRDGQPGTADDLDFQTVLDQMKSHRTTLLYVVSGGGSTSQANLVNYWKQWAQMTNTGGDALSLADAAALPAAIQNLVTSAGSRISRLELRTVPASYQGWLTVAPPAYTDLVVPPGGMTVKFEVDIRVPEGTRTGTSHTFEVKAIGDGAVYGGQGVTIHIPASCAPATFTPTPTPTTTHVTPPTPTPTTTPVVCPPTRPQVTIACLTPNLVRNPDFERGNRSWGELSSSGRELVEASGALDGFFSASFYGSPGEPSDEWLYQFVDVPPDAESMSFWVDHVARYAAAVNPPPVSAGNFFRASLYDLTVSTELVRLWEFDPLLPQECAIDPPGYNLSGVQLDLLRGHTIALVFRFQKVTLGWHAGVRLDGVHLTACAPTPPCRVTGTKSASPGEVPAGGEATVSLSLTGQDGACLPSRQPADVALVMDVSGSMSGQPIVDAKQAAKGFVDRMEPGNDQVALVSFSDGASVNQVLATYAGNLRAAIDALSAVGNTNMTDAITRAQSELESARHKPANGKVIVLLSDGKPNVGGDPRAAAAAAKAAGIRIFTIGLGSDVDPALLREVATAPGDYFYAPASDQLEAIYQQISGLIGGSPATDITIVDRLSSYVTLVPGSFSGMPLPQVSPDGKTLTWRIPRLGLETKIWTYRVKLTTTAGLWPTNDSATATYTDSRGKPAGFTFPIPQVRVRPVAEGQGELVCRDHRADTGVVPSNPNGEAVWDSPDIWIRNQPDGGLDHQNPLAGQSNTVYVRVRNIGTAPVDNIVVHVYDAAGGTSLRWPDDWAPAVGRATVSRLAAGASTVVAVSWLPNFTGHYCFLVRMEAPTDPIRFDGWVPFDNNLCQKNVQILEPSPSGSTSTGVGVGNRNRGSGYGSVSVKSNTFPAGATGRIAFGTGDLFERWQLAGGEAKGGTVDAGTKSVRFGPKTAVGWASAGRTTDAATVAGWMFRDALWGDGGWLSPFASVLGTHLVDGTAAVGSVDLMLERLPFDGDELDTLTFEVTGLGSEKPPVLMVEQFQDGQSLGGVTLRPATRIVPNGIYLPVTYDRAGVGAAEVAGAR